MNKENINLKSIIQKNGDFIITIKDLLFVIFKFKFWIIIACFLIGLITIIVVLQSKMVSVNNAIIKPKFISKAIIIIPTAPYLNIRNLNLDQELGNAANDSGINIKGIDIVELSSELVRSNLVIDPVIEKYNLLEKYNLKKISDCREKIKNNLNFNYTEKKRNAVEKKLIIKMFFSDEDPERAKSILNDIIINLNNELIKISQKKTGENILFLEKRLKEVNNTLLKVEEEIFLLQKEFDLKNTNSGFLNDQLSDYINRNQRLNREYISLEKISDILFSQYELNKLKYNDSPQIILIEKPDIPDEAGNLSLFKILIINIGSGFFITIIFIYIYYIIIGRSKKYKK